MINFFHISPARVKKLLPTLRVVGNNFYFLKMQKYKNVIFMSRCLKFNGFFGEGEEDASFINKQSRYRNLIKF